MRESYVSRCERQVMKVIWQSKEELDLANILKAVNKNTGYDWKPQTVSTFLSRLVKKGYLKGTRKGRYVYYQPLITREKWIIAAIKEDCDIANIPSESVIEEVLKLSKTH